MKNKRRARHLIVLATALAITGGGAAALVLANSAGAATPARATAAQTRNGHIVPMAPPSAPAPVSAHSAAVAPGAPAAPSGTAAGQLSAAQLPAATTQDWTSLGQPRIRNVTGHDIGENECVSVAGATTWTQRAFSGDGGQTAAIQDTFSFGSSAAAQDAYQAMVDGMAHCQAISRAYQSANHTPANAVVTQTASLAHAVAWERTWTGVSGMSAAGPQTNHLYLAAGGSVLIVLQFTEFPGQVAPYSVAQDAHVLATLDAELAR